MTTRIFKLFLVLVISIAGVSGCSGGGINTGGSGGSGGTGGVIVESKQTPLEAAASSCNVRSGFDSAGNFSDTDYGSSYIDQKWACLVTTVAGEAVLDTLLQANGFSGPINLSANGYTFSFSYNGNAEIANLSIIKN